MSRMKRKARSVPAIPLFVDPEAPLPQRRTYVILGVPRGGTTSVAGTARMCGLPIGDDLPTNLEDPAFNLDLHTRAGRDPLAEIRAALRTRNDQRQVWGWKYPRAGAYLDDVRDEIVDPRLIVVTRDIVATSSWGAGRRESQAQMDTVRTRINQTLRNVDLVDRWKVPTLMVSYERAITMPEQFVPLLCGFLGLPTPTDLTEILAFLEPGSYKPVPGEAGSDEAE